jgi:hypothetical protein
MAGPDARRTSSVHGSKNATGKPVLAALAVLALLLDLRHPGEHR